MSWNPNALATSAIQRVRLMVGDIQEFPLLEDSVYQYLILDNNNSELDAAIDAVESIITMLVLNPTDEDVGQVGQKTRTVADFKTILADLQDRKYRDANKAKRIPIVLKTDKASWGDIDTLYRRD